MGKEDLEKLANRGYVRRFLLSATDSQLMHPHRWHQVPSTRWTLVHS